MQVTDQTGRNVFINRPHRIVSLVPSQTELLYDLGLGEKVVGITKFCVHPDAWYRTKTRIGGTKKLHIEIIKELNPDLILANKEENSKEDIDSLAKEYPVWVSDVKDLKSALEMIRSVGHITGTETVSESICNQILKGFKSLPQYKPIKACYLIWKDPYMTVGGDSFINDMMSRAGFINIYSKQRRYPEIEIKNLQRDKPDIVLLSSEPFPFKEKHAEELKRIYPESHYILVDGEMFSWYGSRLIHAADYFQQLRHEILTKFGYAASDR